MPYLDDLIENLEQSGLRSEIEIHDDRLDAAEALRAYGRALAEIDGLPNSTVLKPAQVCRMIRFRVAMDVGDMDVTAGPDDFQGKTEDGATWSISFDDVVADMHKHDDPKDPWPTPITRSMAKDWLCDNSDNIEGWTLQSAPSLRPQGFEIIR